MFLLDKIVSAERITLTDSDEVTVSPNMSELSLTILEEMSDS